VTTLRLKYVFFSLLLFLEGGAATGAYGVLTRFGRIPPCPGGSCPELDRLADYRLPEPPTLYDAEGRLFSHLDGQTRLTVRLADMPPALVDGYVAVEDRRFWSHGGVDLRGIARASAINLSAGDIREGASTITMQLARTLWQPALEHTGRWHRKLVEARLAHDVEARLGKRRILELYLNAIYMGDGVYGVGTASWRYFGKPVGDLSLVQIATLVGMTRTPERYDPRRNPDLTRRRRNVVLDIMADAHVVAPSAARAARAEPVVTIPVDEAPDRRGASYYAAAVAREVDDVLSLDQPRTGLRVFTAYDPVAQHGAERRLREGLAEIEEGKRGPYRHPAPGAALRARQPGASPFLQGAVMIMDNVTGAIRAVVGGRSFDHSQFDRAMQARRQAGSAFKPIVVAAALASGSASLASSVSTTPLVVETVGGPWSPRDPQARGNAMTVRAALARSSNWAAVRIGQRVGLPDVMAMARALGVRAPLPAVPSLFLGSADVTLEDLTSAYATLANGGRFMPPHLVSRIEDADGKVVFDRTLEGTLAVDPRVAFLTRRAMEDVISSGTGWQVRRAGYTGEAAGKTGTTSGSHDAWFIGMNPEVTTGVWIGFDRPQTIVPGGSGSNLAAPVWGRLMADLFHPPWPTWSATPPPGLLKMTIEPGSGFLSTESCQMGTERAEYFIPGTEPHSVCDLLSQILLGYVGPR
jgi:penicillin-binding protein 1A